MHDRLANILCITSYSYNYDEDRYLGVSKSQSGEHEVQNCQKKKKTYEDVLLASLYSTTPWCAFVILIPGSLYLM